MYGPKQSQLIGRPDGGAPVSGAEEVPEMRRGIRRQAQRVLHATGALGLGVLSLTLVARPAAAAGASPQTTSVDMVIAVDESASLTADDVSREISATSVIAQSVLNPRSRVTILGFGSDNGKAGQSAVDEVCRPTVVDGAVSLQYLSTCVKGLHRRTDREGDDTDHVAALSQALSTLDSGSPQGALKLVFLLTDGRLDVRHSPQYGSGDDNDPQVWRRRDQAADAQLTTEIGQAQRAGAQIWPLGFGGGVTQAALDRFAAGGSRQGCDSRSVSKPTARIVHDSSDVSGLVFKAYVAAICGGGEQLPQQSLEPGRPRSLKIDIPIIATDGTITVQKGNPGVRVEFFDPHGREVPQSGSLGDSTFTRSGGNGSIEALRIVNPLNGPWTVRLTAPKRLARQLVGATAVWQGAVQAAIVPEPPVARAGQRVTVRLALVTRRGAVTDEKALSGLTFAVTATGPNLPGQHAITVRDDGRAPDDHAHDGRFAGTFTAPGQDGDVSLSGIVSGPAISSERVPVTVQVSAQGPVVQGTVEFGGDATVHPGDVVHGKLTTRNAANAPKRVHLVLDGAEAHAAVSPNGAFDLPPGDSTRDFTVAFGRDAPIGGASVTLKLVDDATPATAYANGLLTVTVKNPPTLWERIRPYVAGAVALLVLIALVLWQQRLAWKRRVGVKGLRAALTLDGEPTGPELGAPSRWSPEFRFIVREVDGTDPRLMAPSSGGEDLIYTARRRGDGVTLRTPDGAPAELAFGAESEPLPQGHRITFRDVRKRRRSIFTRRGGARPPIKPDRADSTEGISEETPDTAYDDTWF